MVIDIIPDFKSGYCLLIKKKKKKYFLGKKGRKTIMSDVKNKEALLQSLFCNYDIIPIYACEGGRFQPMAGSTSNGFVLSFN